MQEMQVWALGQEDPPEKEMATHSSVLAWEIPWTEEPGEYVIMEHVRQGHFWLRRFTVEEHWNVSLVSLAKAGTIP